MLRWTRCFVLGVGCLGVWAAGCAPVSRPNACQEDADCVQGKACIAGACLVAECRTAQDCPAGSTCRDHVCTPLTQCAADGDCPAGQVCEAEACRPGCRTELECLPGRCDPASRTCLACLTKSDCELGELCLDGACAPGCEGDRDCPAGLSCLLDAAPHGLCAECATAEDCAAGEVCLEHSCASPCDLDADCPAGEVCEAGGCRLGCRDEAECPGGRCDPTSRTCVDCLEVDDCVLGELCLDGACTPGCKGSRDCPEGQICLPEEPPHGACVECLEPGDCPDEIAPQACLEPLALDFGSVPPGQTATRSFLVESCGLMDLTVRDLSLSPASSADFSLVTTPALPAEVAVGGALEVQVQYHPVLAGLDSGGVDIYSDDPDADPLTGFTGSVALTGRSDEFYCDLAVAPAAVDFGVVVVDGSAEVELNLTNLGNQDCVLDGVVLSRNSSAGEFSLPTPVGAGTSLAPGEALGLAVAYQPTDLGQDTGALGIQCNDKDTDEVAVELAGFARASGDGPVAVCTVNPTQAAPLETLTWLGDQSYDPSPGRTIQAWTWTVVSFPAGSGATLAELGAANRLTQTDLAGGYTAQLVVRNDIGQTSAPCTATAEVAEVNALSIVLFWNQSGDDLDLHLLAPGGVKRTRTDCYYANCPPPLVLDWGVTGVTSDNPHLDLDDIPGTGPENTNLLAPAAGVYTIFVHDYPGSVNTTANHVTLEVYLAGVKVATLEHDMIGEDTDWDACLVDLPAGIVTPL